MKTPLYNRVKSALTCSFGLTWANRTSWKHIYPYNNSTATVLKPLSSLFNVIDWWHSGWTSQPKFWMLGSQQTNEQILAESKWSNFNRLRQVCQTKSVRNKRCSKPQFTQATQGLKVTFSAEPFLRKGNISVFKERNQMTFCYCDPLLIIALKTNNISSFSNPSRNPSYLTNKPDFSAA